MTSRQQQTRVQFAETLERIAAALRTGGEIKVNGQTVSIPASVGVKVEIERERGLVELEIEATWRQRGGKAARPAPLVGILTGSPSDLPTVKRAADVLSSLGIASEVQALSAHRTPDAVVEYVRTAEARGIETIIACAGLAAHLAGVVAAHTHLPVIGVPLASGALCGLDSLLSTVQMPAGVPVATVGIDAMRNAAILAARILALRYPAIRDALIRAADVDRERYAKSARPKRRAK